MVEPERGVLAPVPLPRLPLHASVPLPPRMVLGRRRLPGGNGIKIGLPGKSILRKHFEENRTSRRPFLLLRISFPGRLIFIQFIPGGHGHDGGQQVRRGLTRRQVGLDLEGGWEFYFHFF